MTIRLHRGDLPDLASPDLAAYAAADAIAIDLIDGERLCELLKQYDLGVATRMIEEVTIDGKARGKRARLR